MSFQSGLNRMPVQDLLPHLFRLGEKKSQQNKALGKVIQEIKKAQIQAVEQVKKTKDSIAEVGQQLQRVRNQDLVPTSKLICAYEKAIREADCILKQFSNRRIVKYKDLPSFKEMLRKHMDMVNSDQEEKEKEKEKGELSDVDSFTDFRSRTCCEQVSSVGNTPVKLKSQQKKTRKMKERENSLRNKFTCDCDNSRKMNLSQYLHHRNTVHRVSNSILCKEVNEIPSQKPGTCKGNTLKLEARETLSQYEKSPKRVITYNVKDKRSLYDSKVSDDDI